ncbi:bifunctional folylpolyglutamate synthase/dihydrofolate synthase [Treponema sp.]|uniref:bifunctional folylpolyglutamate synthase/dihydrofolate synthase n=1 Tax=Treponema sp. TaxID=166 RepID=UPI00298DA371|nr:Mur ligase family protein [Treponema sp.]MCQ2241480.1 bifunctional folylpolyglutamate synthase/dihydrofolate synthase [Treponema sp.]
MGVTKSAIGVFEEFAEEYLNFEKTPEKNIFWLDTMEFLCGRLGNPELKIPAFHVAGSKGKGSVSMMIASILDEAGYKTGLYSSPHILDFIERIGTCKGPFEEAVYEKSVKELMDCVNSVKTEDLPAGRPITWFELVTLLAILSFYNAKCDYSIYEVGLGGRLDATNVLKPAVCCINQIELEHIEFLGDTVEKIAAEKGGIIKENTPVFVAKQAESVKEVFRKIAADRSAPIYFVDEISKTSEVVYKNRQLYCKIESNFFKRPLQVKLNMLGEFQAYNAALAALTVKQAMPDLDEAILEKGLEKAVLPGRFEIDGNIVFDGAHTVKSIGFTMETLGKIYGNGNNSNVHLLFGCAADKEVEKMTEFFKGKFSKITLTKPGSVKECNLERIKKAFDAAGLEYLSCGDYLKAIPNAVENAREEKALLLVTGSFYLVSEVKKYLLCQKCLGK